MKYPVGTKSFSLPYFSVVSTWQLKLADSRTLVVPIGGRDFAVSGPTTWNNLYFEPHSSSLSIATFTERLKHHYVGF